MHNFLLPALNTPKHNWTSFVFNIGPAHDTAPARCHSGKIKPSPAYV